MPLILAGVPSGVNEWRKVKACGAEPWSWRCSSLETPSCQVGTRNSCAAVGDCRRPGEGSCLCGPCRSCVFPLQVASCIGPREGWGGGGRDRLWGASDPLRPGDRAASGHRAPLAWPVCPGRPARAQSPSTLRPSRLVHTAAGRRAQKAPRSGHEVRQALPPLPGESAGRSHERVVVDQHRRNCPQTTSNSLPSGSCMAAA